MREKLLTYYQKLKIWYDSREKREQILLLSMVGIVVFMFGYVIVSSLSSSLNERKARVAKLQQDLDTVTEIRKRYISLKEKQKGIEASFSEMQWDQNEGEMTYLEGLKTKLLAGAESQTDRFRIEPLATVPFGDKYERAQFKLTITVTDLSALVGFLSELSHGNRPLLITRLRVERRPAGDALSVQLDISSIRVKAA
jgi:hypothetical protein